MNSRVRRVALAVVKLCLVVSATIPAVARAQTIRVSGRIVDETGTRPVQGVTLRLTGSDSTLTTGPSGTFSFGGVIPGRYILTAAISDREFQSIPLEIAADTMLTVVMRRIVSLEAMVIRPRVRIRGTVVDAASGEAMLFALVSLYPDGRTLEASNTGKFSFDTVRTGLVTMLVEAVEYLPLQVQFSATRDTTVVLRLGIDSIALRTIALQAERLSRRAQAEPYTLREYGRDLIARERPSSVQQLVDRMMVRSPSSDDMRMRGRLSADDACVFYDDRKVAPGVLDGLYPELIERVEIYRNGAMIRVYSKRYVRSLAGQEQLRKVTFIPTGLKPACE